MTAQLPEKLFTAIGTFQRGADLRVEVAVPNFPTLEEAENYAKAFRITHTGTTLLRDDGLGSGLFDETSREVLDSHVRWLRKNPAQDGADAFLPVEMAISGLAQQPGANDEFVPVAWRVEEDRL
jgi:hypothetical protein